MSVPTENAVAVVGMACRLPGADDLKRLEGLSAALRRWVSGMKVAG